MTLAAVVVLLVYWPETKMSLIEGKTAPLSVYMHRTNPMGRTLGWFGDTFNLPAHAFLLGLDSVAEHNHRGHPTYLLGEVSQKGRWYYFPVAFAVKTPTVVLVLFGLCLVAGAGFLRRKGKLRGAPFSWIVMAVSPVVYFLFSMASNLNLGLRHILPVYPFLFVLVAAVLFRKPVRRPVLVLIALLAGLMVYEIARIYPHYLAFLFTLAGGPETGPDYLVDSNIDWGQDIKKLGAYMKGHGIDKVYLSYFGITDPDYYGVRNRRLEAVWHGGDPENLNGVVAISATILRGAYGGGVSYEWFRRRKPDAKVGYSIYVYDLRKSKT